MSEELNFFRTTMPDSRKADFYLGCLDGSVFLDFNYTADKRISLCRISFDGYGCCDLGNEANSLDDTSSKAFMDEMRKDNLDQENITKIVFELTHLNRDKIWMDALEEYGLIDR